MYYRGLYGYGFIPGNYVQLGFFSVVIFTLSGVPSGVRLIESVHRTEGWYIIAGDRLPLSPENCVVVRSDCCDIYYFSSAEIFTGQNEVSGLNEMTVGFAKCTRRGSCGMSFVLRVQKELLSHSCKPLGSNLLFDLWHKNQFNVKEYDFFF